MPVRYDGIGDVALAPVSPYLVGALAYPAAAVAGMEYWTGVLGAYDGAVPAMGAAGVTYCAGATVWVTAVTGPCAGSVAVATS